MWRDVEPAGAGLELVVWVWVYLGAIDAWRSRRPLAAARDEQCGRLPRLSDEHERCTGNDDSGVSSHGMRPPPD